jgi:AraC-like DNA-binding protein
MDPLSPHGPFSVFAYPYDEFLDLEDIEDLRDGDLAPPGSALVWDLAKRCQRRDVPKVATRPAGMALMLVLPPANRLQPGMPILEITELCRPQTILPHHPRLVPEDFQGLLRRSPHDLPGEFMDYLAWRGIRLDGETRHLLRRTVELSDGIRTVEGLARALLVSRRALGRRFLSRGIPVPSHWLQVTRVLRAVLRLQNTAETLFSVACRYGYPDGFSLSNQMVRLTGVRPSLARERLGWEWLVERWLRLEAKGGSLRFPLARDASLARFRPTRAPAILPRRASGPTLPARVAEPRSAGRHFQQR